MCTDFSLISGLNNQLVKLRLEVYETTTCRDIGTAFIDNIDYKVWTWLGCSSDSHMQSRIQSKHLLC